MPRYIVESGATRMEVQADSQHKAALWAVHQGIQNILPEGVWEIVPEGCREPSQVRRRLRDMGSDVRVKSLERTTEAPRHFSLDPLIDQWSEVMTRLSQLEDELASLDSESGESEHRCAAA